MHFNDITIKSFHDSLKNGEFKALEVVRELFDKIKKEDVKIHSFLTLLEEEAVEQAERVDLDLASGKNISILSGVPLAIKDNMLIEGSRATAGSRILENYVSSYDATVVGKLKKEGAIFLGKTNMDEFAMGSSTENSAFGVTRNPYDLERVPGGSSGGSVAAVAANFALGAFGSDTGGSIREPAAFCGVVGFKPTYGSVSRFGLIAMASSLDQIGPFAKTVEDAEILFDAVRGEDPFDATSVKKDFFPENDLKKIKELRIGLPKEYFIDGLSADVKNGVEEAIAKLKTLGFKFKEISLPHTKYALSVYYIIMPAEVSANLARFDGIRYDRIKDISESKNGRSMLQEIYFKNRGERFGAEVRRRILLGTFVLSAGYYDAYYAKAQKVRQLVRNDFDEAFKKVDVILTPVTATSAFKIGEKADDPLAMYLSDIFTIPVNLAGLPGISIPVKKYEIGGKELPIGFQLIGKHFREADIFGIGKQYEKI
ncbi:MAG: Asp-tRNA(Asn)/Glu-tRNA(Gln) amidotransferase subunit GatA [Patescibacteria group bacterium]